MGVTDPCKFIDNNLGSKAPSSTTPSQYHEYVRHLCWFLLEIGYRRLSVGVQCFLGNPESGVLSQNLPRPSASLTKVSSKSPALRRLEVLQLPYNGTRSDISWVISLAGFQPFGTSESGLVQSNFNREVVSALESVLQSFGYVPA